MTELKTNVPETTTPRRVGIEMYFLGMSLLAMSAYAQNTPVMTCLIVGNIALRFILMGRRYDWVYLLIGVAGGGGNDLMSMLKDVYYYTPKDVLPIPIWMLLLWGHVFVAFRQFFRLPFFIGPELKGKPWRLDKRLIADIAVVVLFRVIIYNFVHKDPIPTYAFGAVLAARLILIPPKIHEWKLIAAIMILGPAYEAACIRFGLYVYYNPVFLGMPAWLLIYWVFIVPLFMGGIFERMEYSQAAKRNAPAEVMKI